MSFHPSQLQPLANVMVVLCAFWIAGCGNKNAGDGKPQSAPGNAQQSAPERLPEPLVTAWTQAGAMAGWFRQSSPGAVIFLPASYAPKAGDVSAFGFTSLPE